MGKNGREKQNLETQNTIISLNENVSTNEWIFPFPLLLILITKNSIAHAKCSQMQKIPRLQKEKENAQKNVLTSQK